QKLQIPEIGSEFLTVESFKKAGGHTPFVTLQYIIDGKYRNNYNITEETQKRKKYTKHQSCPVILKVILNKNNVWVVYFYKDQHNHELLLLSQVHCFHQYQIPKIEQKELVNIMLRSKAPTRSIANAI
ncbi:8570_t:CDS:2, partial [Cetraspora pellucida]